MPELLFRSFVQGFAFVKMRETDLLTFCQKIPTHSNEMNFYVILCFYKILLMIDNCYFRPDLVDFSKLSKSMPDRNLEYSFHVAEKELGVPRLLDVEGEFANRQKIIK